MTKVQKYYLTLGALFLWGIGLSVLNAQSVSGIPESQVLPLYSFYTFTSEQSEGLHRVPFISNPNHQWDNLIFDWQIDCDLPDTVYFSVQGLGWNADLYLNGRFLSTMTKPLALWVVPLSKAWVREGKNTLTLTCRYSSYFPNYPQPFLGLLQGIHLYETAPVEYNYFSQVEEASIDSVWVWASYFGEEGFSFDEDIALKELFHMSRTSLRYVYFPFPPPVEHLSFVRKWGFIPIDSLTEGMYVGMLNAYPFEPIGFSLPKSFWLDEEGKRTSSYGQFLPWIPDSYYTSPLNPGLGTILIFLFPLLALLVVKFINPNFYYALERIFSKPDKYIDTLNDSSTGNGGFAFVVVLINQLAFSILLFLFVYFIYQNHSWDTMTLLREKSLLTRFFYPIESVYTIFGRSFLIVAGSFLFKYLFLGIVENIFSIRNLVSGIINLDIIGNFPYIQVLSLPLLLLLLYPEKSANSVGFISVFWSNYFFSKNVYLFLWP